MKFGDKAKLAITGVDKKGRGLAKLGERTACVPFAVPGEEVEATLFKRRQGDLVFQLDAVTKPSPHRITPRCAYAGKCGGCAWQQFDYAYQLELKKGLMNAAFAAAGMTETVGSVIPCPDIFHYRNRMDYCVGWKGELGLKAPGRWNAYLDLDECHLLSPDAVKAMAAFRAWMKDNGVAPWDNVKHVGYARYLVIREGKNTGERLMTVVTSDGPLPAQDELMAALTPFATTLYHGVNPTLTDLSIAERLTLLHGKPLLTEKVAGKSYDIPPNSFFQTNTVMAGALLGKVKEYLAGRRPKTLLDLYCGVGFFGIGLADAAERVIGVELDAQAIETAKSNAEKNGLTNASFTAAKAEDLDWKGSAPDTVIVDPPRVGLHAKVIETLLEEKPARIVYVSCNYESFARDWTVLKSSYRLARFDALDLFPHSPHVELVTLLERK
jgi:23S rRNA (uracil-5-)-methyltransferase RumA